MRMSMCQRSPKHWPESFTCVWRRTENRQKLAKAVQARGYFVKGKGWQRQGQVERQVQRNAKRQRAWEKGCRKGPWYEPRRAEEVDGLCRLRPNWLLARRS